MSWPEDLKTVSWVDPKDAFSFCDRVKMSSSGLHVTIDRDWKDWKDALIECMTLKSRHSRYYLTFFVFFSGTAPENLEEVHNIFNIAGIRIA